ncbi:MAG: GTPase domain-containing protein [Deltaproteobacteria bacterium]|nr:GTPase domain-containing protein [Deltaproteobacteria bacterium]
MSSVNPLTKEILLKLVYFGPGLGGKTTTLQYIHRTARPEHRGKMVSLATPVDRTLYFDFLPVRLPRVGGYTLRLQLFTVPGQVHYNATRKLVLTGADGVVFVADSQRSRLDANMESLENLFDNLHERDIDTDAFAFTFQYNKRDIADILPVAELDARLNPKGRARTETCAITGEGIYRGLEAITKEVLRELKRRDAHAKAKHEIAFHKDDQSIAKSVRALRENAPSPVVLAPLAAPPHAAGLSYAALWPAADRDRAAAIESAIEEGRNADATRAVWQELTCILDSAGHGLTDQSPSSVIALLGLDGRGYLDISRLARTAEAGAEVPRERVLRAYLFLLEALRRTGA